MARKVFQRDENGHIIEDQRTCNKCNITQLPSSFREYKKRKTNGDIFYHRLSICKKCEIPITNAMNKRYKETGYSREHNLKRLFNMTIQEYNDLFKSQSFKCKICYRNKDINEKNFPVDHDHLTGKVRAILCPQCNLAIGGYKDNWKLILNAIKYLKESK